MYLLKPSLNMFFRKFANCKIRFWMGFWVFMAKREKKRIFDTMHLSLQIIVVLVISPEEIRGNSSHPVQCGPDSYFKSSRLSVNIKCLSMLPTITDFFKEYLIVFLGLILTMSTQEAKPTRFLWFNRQSRMDFIPDFWLSHFMQLRQAKTELMKLQ